MKRIDFFNTENTNKNISSCEILDVLPEDFIISIKNQFKLPIDECNKIIERFTKYYESELLSSLENIDGRVEKTLTYSVRQKYGYRYFIYSKKYILK